MLIIITKLIIKLLLIVIIEQFYKLNHAPKKKNCPEKLTVEIKLIALDWKVYVLIFRFFFVNERFKCMIENKKKSFLSLPEAGIDEKKLAEKGKRFFSSPPFSFFRVLSRFLYLSLKLLPTTHWFFFFLFRLFDCLCVFTLHRIFF